MSASDFRQITVTGDRSKSERLFRAAVSAFCSLTRPSRREIAQLEDLTLPLFDCVSVEARRYVAAALSECDYPPSALVKRLANEPVDVAAPLLIRSRALSDIDLIVLIGRHGHGHARTIARRPGLNATIADLIAALNRKAAASVDAEPEPVEPAAPVHLPERQQAGSPQPTDPSRPAETVENARRRLRSMMQPAAGAAPAPIGTPGGHTLYGRLRDTALSGHAAFFETALADALAIDFALMHRVANTSSSAWLAAALRAVGIREEQAFLITAAVRPGEFYGPESIRLFLTRYRSLSREAAIERVRAWHSAATSSAGGVDAIEHANAPALDDPAFLRAR